MIKRSIKKNPPLLGKNGLQRGNCAFGEAGVQRGDWYRHAEKSEAEKSQGLERNENSCLMASQSHGAQLCFLHCILGRLTHTLSMHYFTLELDPVDLRSLRGNHP